MATLVATVIVIFSMCYTVREGIKCFKNVKEYRNNR